MANIEEHVNWMSDVESIKFVSDVRSGVGTKIRVRTSVGPFRIDDVMEFRDWDPPHSMSVAHVGLVKGSGEFHLTTHDSNTTLVWIERLLLPWYLGGPVGLILVRPILRKIFAANLRRFAATFQ